VNGNRKHLARIGLSFAVVLFLQAASALAAVDTVAKIEVEGNKRLSRNAVLSYIKTRPGTAYEEKIAREDRDRLLASGRFQSVIVKKRQTPDGVVVIFEVAELPVVQQLSIIGAKQFSEDKLRTDLPFGQGDPLNKASIQTGRQAIINKYNSEGYHFVKVTVDPKELADQKVIYRIVEGPRTIIKKVIFDGNHYFSNFSLLLKTKTKAKFWPFIKGELNNEKIERDVTTIRSAYVAEGFLDCEVGRRLDFSDDKTEVKVVFLIKEGPRYRVNEVVFHGNTVYSDQELRGRLNLHQGSFLTEEVLRRDQKVTENTYGEVGYIEAAVTVKKRFVSPTAPPPAWARDLDGGKPALVNLVYTIEEKDQYRIGTIRIRGNTITQERVIRRECTFYPEQVYNNVAVDYSKSRLQQTRLFDDVVITPVGTKKPHVKDVLIEVKEGRTAEFLVGVGVSSNSGLLGTVSFKQRNFDILAWPSSFKDILKPQTFKGAGQTFSVNAEPGTELMRFTVGWSTPYLFDLPYHLGVKGYLFTRGYEHYDEQRLGVQASLGHRFKNRWYGEVATRLEGVRIDVDKNRAPVEVIEDEGSHTLLGFRGSLTRDRTDNRWMPSKGDRLSFGYEQVVGTDTFGRFNASYNIYHTVYVDALDRKHILAGRMQFGQIVGDAPVFEKFYGGGIGSIRGFKYRGISPRGHWADGSVNDDPIGGDMMFFAGTEYSFPILADKLRGVVFIDSGTVESDFELTTYRISAGFGVRWTIPFFGPVPLALDFGFPLNKDENDDTQIFSFSLGWTF
jgi:outer membrane protein insertion porin family